MSKGKGIQQIQKGNDDLQKPNLVILHNGEFSLVIIFKNGKKIIPLKDILYLECDTYITTVHTINNKETSSARLLKEYEIALSEYNFVRINHNIIINKEHICETFFSAQKNTVSVKNVVLQVSRRKKNRL